MHWSGWCWCRPECACTCVCVSPCMWESRPSVLCFSRVLSADDLTSGYSSGDPDPADLTSAEDTKVRSRPDPQDTFGPMPEEVPRALGKVRRTQSLSASTLSLHRTSRRGGGEAGRPGLRSGRGSGAADDPGAPHASYSGQGQPSGHHATGFRRSRPGEVSLWDGFGWVGLVMKYSSWLVYPYCSFVCLSRYFYVILQIYNFVVQYSTCFIMCL